MPAKYVPFRPALEGILSFRFFQRIRSFIDSDSRDDRQLFSKLSNDEVFWSNSQVEGNPIQHAIFRGCWLLLRDLQRIGWTLSWRSNTLYLGKPQTAAIPKTPVEITEHKQAIRDAMSFARVDRIGQYSDFIERMITPTTNGLAKHSMLSLVGKGDEIATDLRKVTRARSPERRSEMLRSAVQPYLQLVSENNRCEHTGHRLADIWRFFRFTWSNPPETTPGRTLLYLVRDAARPCHPVMGIFSLENAPLRISCRDHYLGWTPESFVKTLRDKCEGDSTVRTQFEFLIESLDRGIDDIDWRGLCKRRDITRPTERAVQSLSEIARESDDQRMVATKNWQDRTEECEEEVQSELGNISLAAEKALYRRKRAEALSRLLSAKIRIQRLLLSENLNTDVQDFIRSESGIAAIRSSLVGHFSKSV